MTDKSSMVRAAIAEAVRAGLDWAARTIDDYGRTHPDAMHHCDQLAATLRDKSASLVVTEPDE